MRSMAITMIRGGVYIGVFLCVFALLLNAVPGSLLLFLPVLWFWALVAALLAVPVVLVIRGMWND